MAFAPENPLEEALARAAADPAARPQFYGLLMQSPLLVLGHVEQHAACDEPLARLGGRKFELALVAAQGRSLHPLFTSPRRLRAFDPAPPPYFTVIGRALFNHTRGAGFLLNCGSEAGKELLPEEIAHLLDTRLRPLANHHDIVFRQPDPYPGRLTGALGIYFLNRTQVVSAHLVETVKKGREPPHLLIGLVAHGDWRHIAAEIGEVAASIKAPHIIDVTVLDPVRPRNKLQARLLAIPPFYARALTPHSQGIH